MISPTAVILTVIPSLAGFTEVLLILSSTSVNSVLIGAFLSVTFPDKSAIFIDDKMKEV